jgi:hypothetical protein
MKTVIALAGNDNPIMKCTTKEVEILQKYLGGLGLGVKFTEPFFVMVGAGPVAYQRYTAKDVLDWDPSVPVSWYVGNGDDPEMISNVALAINSIVSPYLLIDGGTMMVLRDLGVPFQLPYGSERAREAFRGWLKELWGEAKKG